MPSLFYSENTNLRRIGKVKYFLNVFRRWDITKRNQDPFCFLLKVCLLSESKRTNPSVNLKVFEGLIIQITLPYEQIYARPCVNIINSSR